MARRIPTSCVRGPNTSRRARGAWCSLEGERRMGGPMRGIVVVGIALIVLGVVALAWQGITYTSKEKVVDVGPLKVEAERQTTPSRRKRATAAALRPSTPRRTAAVC